MNSLRKSLGFVLAIMLTAFAGSSIAAQQKLFYAVVQASIGGAPTYTVTLHNSSPGPSTINSFLITPPKNGNTPLLTISSVSPGTAIPTGAPDGSVVVNGFPGIKKDSQQIFTVTFTNPAPGCNTGTTFVDSYTGNAYPQGDKFFPDTAPGRMQLTSFVGCAFVGNITCGQFVETPIGNAGPDDSGYAKVTVTNLDKNGDDCVGTPMTYTIDNTLLFDNKLAVLLTGNDNAAFIANINSTPLPPDSTGWFSQKVKVATTKDSNGQWVYVDAKACTCIQAPLKNCMPVPNQFPQLCVAAYDWLVNNAGFAVYSATLIGVGADPAMGWQ